MENSITPADVNSIKTATPEEIMQVSETVIEATKVVNEAADELAHLSNCLADFSVTHEKYQKNVTRVRNQMRYLTKHM